MCFYTLLGRVIPRGCLEVDQHSSGCNDADHLEAVGETRSSAEEAGGQA
jgi:hypothetical protein